MNRIKSIFVFLVFVVLVSQMLSGCQRGTLSQSATSGPTNTQTIQTPSRKTSTPSPTLTPTVTPTIPAELLVEPAVLDGIHLNFAYPMTGEADDAMKSIIDEFNSTNVWGISVNAISTGGNGGLLDSVNQGLAFGTPPNVLAASNDQIQILDGDSGVLIDLTNYIFSTEWGLSDQEKADFLPNFWQADKVSGKQMAVPGLLDMQVLFYNQSWGGELGFFNPPTTPDEFREQACAAAQERHTLDGTGGWVINNQSLVDLSWLKAFGFNGLPETGDNYSFDTSQAEEAFTFLKELFDSGCAWQSRENSPYGYFANRQALFYSGTLGDMLEQSRAQEHAGNTDAWTIIPYPSTTSKPVVISEGYSYAILSASPEEQLASWLFIRWMILPRNQATLAEASDWLPAGASVIESMTDFRSANPLWNQAIAWIPIAESAPVLPSWRKVRFVLEDATWQIFQPNLTADQIPQLLQQLDDMILEVLQH